MAQVSGSVLDGPVSSGKRRVESPRALSFQPMPSEKDPLAGLDLGDCDLGFDYGTATRCLRMGSKAGRNDAERRYGELNRPYDPFLSFFPPILAAMLICEYAIPWAWKILLTILNSGV